MKETLIRLLSGSVYVGIIIGLGFVDVIWSALAFLLIGMQAAREFGLLFWKQSNGRIETVVYLFAALYAALVCPLIFEGVSVWQGLVGTLVVFLFIMIVILRNSTNIRSAAAGLLMGAPLIACTFAISAHLRAAGMELFLGMFILLWCSDTFAYVWGRLLGRTKLLPKVSPGKTTEGFLGGLLSTLAIAYALSQFWSSLTVLQWLLAAALISGFGVVGDLVESALKRQRGVKDSGTLMPGHGGMLDRFDGLLLAAPVYFVFLKALAVI